MEKKEKKADLEQLIEKRNHTIYVIWEIHNEMEKTQETMDFWIRRLDEELEILENQNKAIQRY